MDYEPAQSRQAPAEFAEHLRHALNRLYDPTFMRRSPLAMLFGVSNRADAPSALQRILIDAIQALRPRSGEPSQSLSWCLYSLLSARYVQQVDQQQVANQLGISERTMRRRQDMAVEALADYLWKQFDLGRLPQQTPHSKALGVLDADESPYTGGALAWLKDSPFGGITDLGQVLMAALDLVQPLAVQHGICVARQIANDLPELSIHPVALKQIIVNLLHVAIHHTSSGRVTLVTERRPSGLEMTVHCGQSTPAAPLSAEDAALLGVTHELVNLCGGRMTHSAATEPFAATVSLPLSEQLVVLAVDDQADTLQLLERYVLNTRYHLVGTRDPSQALSLAERLSPRIIVVDIMMPDVDGWSVLAMLRQHALTRGAAIVVCTILPQRELAISLGADDFIQKPLSRQAFLQVLDRQIADD